MYMSTGNDDEYGASAARAGNRAMSEIVRLAHIVADRLGAAIVERSGNEIVLDRTGWNAALVALEDLEEAAEIARRVAVCGTRGAAVSLESHAFEGSGHH